MIKEISPMFRKTQTYEIVDGAWVVDGKLAPMLGSDSGVRTFDEGHGYTSKQISVKWIYELRNAAGVVVCTGPRTVIAKYLDIAMWARINAKRLQKNRQIESH